MEETFFCQGIRQQWTLPLELFVDFFGRLPYNSYILNLGAASEGSAGQGAS